MTWCRHLDNAKVRFSIFRCSGDHWNAEETTENINFCPICGAQKPEKMKTLSEKFAETSIVRGDATCGMTPMEKAKILERMAFDHFKERPL